MLGVVRIHPPPPDVRSSAVGPSLLQKGLNFAAAAAKHMASGAKTVSDQVRASRLALCLACEHYVDKKCAKCGCGIRDEAGMIDKLSWESERCPVGKW
jgi:hypothetical protein